MKTTNAFLLVLFFCALLSNSYAQCSYSIVLKDDYGDGWNTGEVTVNVAGTDVGTYTIISGSGPETHYFAVNVGDAISVTYFAGSFPQENEYYIYDSDNNEVFSDGVGGSPPSANNTFVANASCPTCVQPNTLTASGITSNSANLSWIEGGIATTWNIEYGLTGFTQGSGTIISGVTSNPYNLAGLSPATVYDFYVQADCGGGDLSGWAGPESFATACVTLTAPYFQNFENGGNIPPCWNSFSSTTELWLYQTTNQANGNSAPADHTTGTGYYAWCDDSEFPATSDITLESPLVDVSGLTVPQVAFWLWSHDAGNGVNATLSIDVWDGAAWNIGMGVYSGNTNGWEQRFINLSTLTITGPIQVRLIVNEDNGEWWDDIAVDDFEIREAPTCPEPYFLSAANISDVQADLGWTEGGVATTWNIELGISGFTPTGSPTQTGVTSNPYSYTGLTAATSYEFYVQADCGGGDLSLWTGPFLFTTASCPIASQCTYWLVMIDQYNDGWNNAFLTLEQDGISIGDFTLQTGNYDSIPINLCEASSIDMIWTTGSFDGEISMHFYDPFGQEVTGFNQGAAPAAGSFYTYTAYCVSPVCPQPLNLGVVNVSDVSADLGWTEMGTSTTWHIEWGNNGFILGTGNYISAVTSNPYSLSGLSSATTYDFYVRSDCGADTSYWSGPYVFTTASCPLAEQCLYSMVLEDTFGDGWDNGSITVEQNGISIGDFTLASGGLDTIYVSLCDSSSVTLIWNPSNFPDECSFAFYDPFGQLLTEFASGAAPASGPFFSSTVYCTAPTCITPGNLGALNITDSSAELNWTENGTATTWNIEYGLAGFIQGAGTMITGVTTNPYNLTGLSFYTEYSFYIQADCGGGDQSYWAGPYSFMTLMPAINNPSTCEMGITITDGSCIDVPVNVSIPWSQLGVDVEVSEAKIIIAHTFDGDLSFSLESPNGALVYLSVNNGGSGDNYGIIDGTCTQFTSYQMSGATTGTAPFVGTYTPDGNFDTFNDNSNPNGQWVLHICDNSPPDEGTLEFFEIVFSPILPPADIVINEVDADQAGIDTMEFVELFDGGIGNYPLDGYTVAFYNGSSDQVYQSFDLDGYFTSAEGYFVLGNAAVSGVDFVFADGLLQNGADAVALYMDNVTNLPVGTPLTTTNLVDALVYETNDAIDIGLLNLLNIGQPQINEDGSGDKDLHSNSRIPNGSGGMRNTAAYKQAVPTPDAINQALPYLVWDALIFGESLSNDGSIGNIINIELQEEVFSTLGSLTQGLHYNSANIPVGLNIQITTTSDTTAIVELTGAATSHLNVDDINNLNITFLDAAFANVSTIYITDYLQSGLVVDFFDSTPKTLVWGSTAFHESVVNDGSVDDTITLTLWSETFVINTGLFTENTHYTVSNLPVGLTLEITATGDSSAVIVITGNAISHSNSDDVNNLEIEFLNAAFTGNVAIDISAYIQSALEVDFIDPYLVDLSLSIYPDTIYSCNNSYCSPPDVYIVNTGNLSIPQSDSIFIYTIYPPLLIPVEDTVILLLDLDVGDSVLFNPVCNYSQLGIYDMQTYIYYDNDVIALNDTAVNSVNVYEVIADLGGINDTIEAPSYPYILDAGSCSGPFVCNYLWSTTETTQTISVNTDSWYSVTITDAFGCISIDTIYVYLPVGVNKQLSGKNSVCLYPNPTEDYFTLEITNSKSLNYMITMIDLKGDILIKRSLIGTDIIADFNVDYVSPGVYFVIIRSEMNVYYEKVVIR